MPRFFVKETFFSGQIVALPDTTVRHIQALRLKPEAEVTLFNGEGGEWQARLTPLGRRDIQAELLSHQAIERESPLDITLVQGVSSGERMDYTLQKAVELGVSGIQPLLTERAARIPVDRLESRQLHWQRVVESACEQCGRNRVPEVKPLLSWKAWQQAARELPGFILSPLGTTPLPGLPQPAAAFGLLAGPEGGLTPAEEASMLTLGWLPVKLGPRILRTETAALAALAALQTLWGDYGDA